MTTTAVRNALENRLKSAPDQQLIDIYSELAKATTPEAAMVRGAVYNEMVDRHGYGYADSITDEIDAR